MIICSLAVILIAGLSAFNTDKLSATDILEVADFNAENLNVRLHTIDYEGEELSTKVELSKETQQEILNAFKNSKFEKATGPENDYDYSLNIIVNSSHRMFLDSTNKTVTVMDNTGTDNISDYYTIVNGSDFFDILEKSTK